MGDIKIVRLQSGEDIIANITEIDGTAEVIMDDPMTILFKRLNTGRTMMVMTPWLPVELIEDNRATIFAGDIITILEPRESLKKYYEDLVIDYNDEIEEYNNKFDLSIMEGHDDEEDIDEEDIDLEDEEHLVPNKQLLH